LVILFGFYNSTSIPSYIETETDPIWTAIKSSYSTTAEANALYAGITEPVALSLGNFSAWDKDYDDLTNTPTFTNDTWVDTYFVRFTELVSQIGNWTLDKTSYSTKTIADTLYVDIGGDTMTGDLNMSNQNITTVDCIIFKSGGKFCSGS